MKDGTLETLQEGSTNVVTTGCIIFEASNELLGLRNIGTNQATYFVLKFVPHDLVKQSGQGRIPDIIQTAGLIFPVPMISAI